MERFGGVEIIWFVERKCEIVYNDNDLVINRCIIWLKIYTFWG